MASLSVPQLVSRHLSYFLVLFLIFFSFSEYPSSIRQILAIQRLIFSMNNRTDLHQELLENSDFVSWASGEAPGDEPLWLAWAGSDSDRHQAMDKARQVVQLLVGKPVVLTDEHVNAKISEAIRVARQQEMFEHGTRRVWWRSAHRLASVAAVLALVAFGTYWWYQNRTVGLIDPAATVLTQNRQQKSDMHQVVNETAESRYIGLPDGSSVVLKRGSRLTFPRQFADHRREVHLSGEAFFEVAKNPAQPFLVYAGDLVTKVLGTSFSIKAFTGQPNVEVVVKTGKVSVFSKTDKNAEKLTTGNQLAGLVLLPNQRVTFGREDVTLNRSDVKAPTLLNIPIESQTFEYESSPVSEVFANLEKAYGVDVVYNQAVMTKCSITATLGDEPLANKLKWICNILEATYEVNQNQIIITGKPCQ
ncbi:FecR domain-containing protein [Larkinella sp. GY13]|uniref:FecR domain-containing protein n=1 Tax=Larkinella sp. GY13 TaxID=3453720 RepID=UPI003EE9202B